MLNVRRLQSPIVTEKSLTPLPVENGDAAANIQQPGAQWATHEKPDDQVHQIEGRAQIQQMEGRMIIQENPGDEIYELPPASGTKARGH